MAGRMMQGNTNIPEGFHLSMALTDCIPVLFFSINAGVLACRFPSLLFRIGAVLVILAGSLKAGWKFVIALKKIDVPFLNRQMRFLMPSGFALMLLALAVDHSRWSASAVLHHVTAFPSCIFFLAGVAGILVLCFFAKRLDGRDARSNWKEQMVNGITQLSFLLGILF